MASCSIWGSTQAYEGVVEQLPSDPDPEVDVEAVLMLRAERPQAPSIDD
jgi:hypothetical protein